MEEERSRPLTIEETDILIIGSGLAGLFLAYKASSYARVTVITKREAYSSNTSQAQGGIAAVFDDKDSNNSHIMDTLATGKGLSHAGAVKTMVRGAKERIEDLINIGVRFDRDEKTGLLKMTREGGHSNSRVVHYRDFVGREVSEKMIDSVKANSSIELNEYHFAIDLITDNNGSVIGSYVLDRKKNEVKAIIAKSTVLATGGAGKIYLYTSNPDVAVGDGIAMAYMAGARLANLEFVQFHPTCLYHPEAKSLLVSEALRGEGAILRNLKGIEFMEGKDPRRELAPRDVVARAIDSEMKRSGAKFVYLDITHRSSEWLKTRFPFVYENCLKFGIDIGKDQIPVVPAAHYMVGGVKTDISGRTNVKGLYAVGEVACSGVHGANRLASNSLLEALVMAEECSVRIKKEMKKCLKWDKNQLSCPELGDIHRIQTVILDHDWDLVRRVMWDYVGIVRSDERLNIARKRVWLIRETINRIYARYGISVDMVELRNIALVSSLVVYSAILRKESRGLHYNSDYPYINPDWEKDTILEPGII
jgi:L-aspartate oxidase